MISLLADRVLLAAYSKQVRPIPVAMVEKKAKEMLEAQGAWPDEPGSGIAGN